MEAAGEDEDALVEVDVAVVVPPVFVVVASDPEEVVVAAAPPGTLTLDRVAGGSAVLACVSCLNIHQFSCSPSRISRSPIESNLQSRHTDHSSTKPQDQRKPVQKHRSAPMGSTKDTRPGTVSMMGPRRLGGHSLGSDNPHLWTKSVSYLSSQKLKKGN